MPKTKVIDRIPIILPVIMAMTFIACFASGCAMIFSDTQQELRVKPAGASIDIYSWDGTRFAPPEIRPDGTFTVHRPRRGESYVVLVQKEGYCPKYWITPLTEEDNPVVTSILFLERVLFPLGWFGKDIDQFSGAPYTFNPTEFELNIPDTQPCGS